jgi:multiple sugar transport system substrate-binding protein
VSKNKALAWELIEMMTLSPDMQLQAFKSQDAFPSLLSVQGDPFFDQPMEFLGGEKARQMWRDATQKITAIQVNKLDPIAGEIVDTELDKVLDQGKDIPTALADAKRLLQHRVDRYLSLKL